MNSLKVALFGLAITLLVASCKSDDTPQPTENAEQYKVVVVNEGAIHGFTQQLALGVSGTDEMSAEITGTEWDEVILSDGLDSPKRHFLKTSDVPSAATYKTTNELSSLSYQAIIKPKEGAESTMKTKITFYRAGERIGEKVFTINGKGGVFAITHHDDYDMFDNDLYQPL